MAIRTKATLAALAAASITTACALHSATKAPHATEATPSVTDRLTSAGATGSVAAGTPVAPAGTADVPGAPRPEAPPTAPPGSGSGEPADATAQGLRCDAAPIAPAMAPLTPGLRWKPDLSSVDDRGNLVCLWGAEDNLVTLTITRLAQPLTPEGAAARASQDPTGVRLATDERFARNGYGAVFGPPAMTPGTASYFLVNAPNGPTSTEVSIAASGVSGETGLAEQALRDAGWAILGGR